MQIWGHGNGKKNAKIEFWRNGRSECPNSILSRKGTNISDGMDETQCPNDIWTEKKKEKTQAINLRLEY